MVTTPGPVQHFLCGWSAYRARGDGSPNLPAGAKNFNLTKCKSLMIKNIVQSPFIIVELSTPEGQFDGIFMAYLLSDAREKLLEAVAAARSIPTQLLLTKKDWDGFAEYFLDSVESVCGIDGYRLCYHFNSTIK